MSHVAHKETHQTFYNINLDTLKLVNNRVLCRKVTHNIEEPRNGIYYPPSFHENQYLAENVDRVFEVVRVPDRIKKTSAQRWDTDCEVKPGDLVWVKPIDSLNSPDAVDTDGNEYRMLPYASLVVAKREGEVVPLNGYVLMMNIYTEKAETNSELEFIYRPAIIYALGSVRYFGEKNKAYHGINDDDEVDLQKGQLVVLDLPNKNEKSMNRAYLEDDKFKCFDQYRYFYEQRRAIMGFIENQM